MSYTINLTNGTVFAVIPDGTINQSSSMTLVGKNYAGYGQFLDDNFIRLLENNANSTAPTAPIVGQLWFNTTSGVLQVYNGAGFKSLGGSQVSGTAPSNNSEGDLWYNSTSQQLFVWTGTAWLLVGPTFSGSQGTTGAIPTTIVDSFGNSHVVIELYTANTIVGMVSKDQSFIPQTAINGFSSINPGIQLTSNIANAYFYGTATNSLALGGLSANNFISSTGPVTLNGTLAVANNIGMTVGTANTFSISINGANVILTDRALNGSMIFQANVGGIITNLLTINGANGTVSGQQIDANYADVAERFAADQPYAPGTVVELGGTAEITQSNSELSESVFGVISTKAAYLMNSRAGSDATHPPVAMTGRVPVQVVGRVQRGDRLVSAGQGRARAADSSEVTAFNTIGRSLEDKLDNDLGVVEAIVTIR